MKQAMQLKEESQRQLLALFEQSPIGLARLSANDGLVFQWANTFYGKLVMQAPIDICLLNASNLVIERVNDAFVEVAGKTGAVVSVDSLPGVAGNRLQLEQLFQNLLSNALKFHRAGASPVIHVGYQQTPYNQLPALVKPTQAASYYHQIDVTDNGVGFDEKYLDRIFPVFQRQHGRNEFAGTDIGLAICEKVAANHGGAITPSSLPGQGATPFIFRYSLPQRIPNGYPFSQDAREWLNSLAVRRSS